MRISALFALGFLSPALFGDPGAETLLDRGYREMYNLRFEDAHRIFGEWSRQHPEDPLGPASDAAAYLFAEFDRLHILQSDFFVHDEWFRNAHKLAPDPELKRRFDQALEKTRQLTDRALARSPKDSNALFAGLLRLGLSADYLALIDHSYVASFRQMKAGRALAQRLLAADPQCYDAHIAVGVENYMLSLKPAPLRWLLRLGGAQTSKEQGLRQLRITAEKGRYLRPYARLLLAVAALRDRDRRRATELLRGLASEFPQNPLYAQELARLQAGAS